ncbi:hypothetical protein GCM10022226_00450 [Sphaerisporangium flaviroseum]|uniref:STAS domain-containing protein n=1 Tax=Sphaerisporangium flaviroseum TaxID=509199 RepID=A0ABP7HDZ4_9ACTN
MGVTLHGDLDYGAAGELRRSLSVLLARGERLQIDLDLAHVTFLDCSGARTLKWLDRCIQGGGGRLTIVRPSRRVLRLLQLLRFDDVLGICQEERNEDVLLDDWRIIRLRSLCLDPAPSSS